MPDDRGVPRDAGDRSADRGGGSAFDDLVHRRRMVRSYDPSREVDRATVDALIDLARQAPSAGATQGWHFLVLDTAAHRDLFWSATADDGPPDRWLAGMRTAPVLVVVLSDRAAYEIRYGHPDKSVQSGQTLADRWPVPYWHIDAGMAALILLLGAVDRELAGCFFGVPRPRVTAVLEAFAVPPDLVPVGVVSLGYPAPGTVSAPATGRRSGRRRGRSEVVSYGRFGESAPSSSW